MSNGRLWNAGYAGYGWSSQASSATTHAYDLDFTISGIDPSYNNYRMRVYPLRYLKVGFYASVFAKF